jgi:hypothetical protein
VDGSSITVAIITGSFVVGGTLVALVGPLITARVSKKAAEKHDDLTAKTSLDQMYMARLSVVEAAWIKEQADCRAETDRLRELIHELREENLGCLECHQKLKSILEKENQ